MTARLLIVLALLFRDVNFGTVDDRQFPASAPVRQVQQEIRDRFAGATISRIDVLAPAPGYADRLACPA